MVEMSHVRSVFIVDYRNFFSIDLYGLRIGFTLNDGDWRDFIEERLPFGWAPAAPGVLDRQYRIEIHNGLFWIGRDGQAWIPQADPHDATAHLEHDLELFVAEHSPRYVFLHAGVVAWQSRLIVIPGTSFSGKSTLTAALWDLGAEYYSDEFALIDEAGRVHPYQRAIHLRTPYSLDWEQRSVPTRSVPPQPASLVILTRYREGAIWQPRELGTGRTAIELMRHALAAQRSPERVLQRLKLLLEQATVLTGERGDARATAAQILQLLRRAA
jgi:hypothetical protein